MKVASKLRAAFAFYVVSLVALAMFYAREVQRTADNARSLSAMAGRVRVSSDQVARIDLMSADAEKFLATRDARYRDKFATAFREFGEFNARALLPEVLDSLRAHVQAIGAASQDAMRRQLVASERVARRAARVSWLAAGSALILGIVLSVWLVRSIVRPIDRLSQGTREVAAGHLAYRLDAGAADEFSLVARDFNSMTARLAELDGMKKDFVAKVSHDLKTPLSSMQETSSALLDGMAGPLSAKQQQLIELNFESGQRLSAMLGKLLDLSRVEAGLKPVFQPVDLGHIARRSVESANVAAAHRGVRLSLDGPQSPSIVRADTAGISQVLDNLVENAIKFSPFDGQVRVSVVDDPLNREVALTVVDEGPGIPVAERERVFDRFYQTEAGRGVRGRGVGLGLTLCREIVASHGGRIWVDENEPRGSAFHVHLRRSGAALAAIMLIGMGGCASFHHATPGPRPQDPELRIAALTDALSALRARLDSTSAQADSLRLELQRLKEIDLRPRKARVPPSVPTPAREY